MEPERKQKPEFEYDIKPDLRAIPGGGNTSSDRPARGNLSVVPNDDTQGNTSRHLRALEDGAKGGADNQNNPINQQEEEGPWANNTTEDGLNSVKGKLLMKGLNFTKKRGGLIGLLAALGVGGGLLAGFFGPASMVVNLMQNLTITNDSMSTSMERRFLKVFGLVTSESDPICANNTKLTIRCKMGNISNSALKTLEKKGIVAYFENGVTNDTGKKYPPKNPKGYTFNVDGRSINVEAPDLPGYLSKNPKMAIKVFGIGGAFNVSMRAWTGKYITKKFLKNFNLNRNGGLAEEKGKKLSAAERLNESLKKLRSSIPGADKMTDISKNISKKIEGHLNKAKKGGVGYTLAVAGCIVPKMGTYIGAGAAAVQLAQVLPVISETVLKPGSKMMAAASDTPSKAITPEGSDTVNTLLTSQALDKDSGKMLSPLDDPTLQSAMGVNKNKTPISAKYTPGLSFLRSPLVVAANKTNEAIEPGCNVILSPAAMYTAFAVDSAFTIAASSTVVLGIIKVVASIAVSEIASYAITQAVGAVAEQALTELATNTDYQTAVGKDLGTVMGISAMAYFSSASMSRSIPGLKQSQLAGFAQTTQDSRDFQHDMEVASLSPLDTSSRYTFLGSIVHNTNTAMIANNAYSGGVLAFASSLLSIPKSFFNPSASAATDFSEKYCGYAEDFGLETRDANGNVDPTNTPAINASGMPCTGLTQEQVSMSSSEAIDLIAKEGWIDESVTIRETDTIDELVKSGFIKAETPLTDFIESCSNPSTGDYFYNSAGCTTEGTAKSTASVVTPTGNCFTNDNGEDFCADEESGYTDTDTEGVSDSRALTAISVFLLDYQQNASINGNDEEELTDGSTVGGLTERPAEAIDKDRGWTLADGVDYSKYECDPRTQDMGPFTNATYGFTVRLCAITLNTPGDNGDGGNQIASVISTNVMNMFEAAAKDGVDLGLSDGMRKTGAAGYSQHKYGLAMDLGTPRGGQTICYGGDPRTGYGSEANAEAACSSRGGTHYAAYSWLKANAAKYGIFNLLTEPWHWSTSGG